MSDNIEDYQITPDDLGCGPEPENPAGLVEQSDVAAPKTPVPKSFNHIPFAVKQRAHKLYDQFEKKDMSFEDFCVQLYALESPKLMQADLHNIVMEKQDRSRQQFASQRNIERNLN